MKMATKYTQGSIAVAIIICSFSSISRATIWNPDNLQGDTNCVWGSVDCNPCINSAVSAVTSSLRTHGDILGFYLGGNVPDPHYDTLHRNDHWQGIQRLTADGGKWLAVSYSDSEGPGGVGFVYMASRSPIEIGGRLRSNRLSNILISNQAPPSSDAFWTKVDSARDDLGHAGGMQALGVYLAVPYEGSAGESEVRIYNAATPSNPWLAYILPRVGQKNSGAVGWTKLKDGRYLLMVGGYDSRPLDFYMSSSITGSYTKITTWSGSFGAYQNTNIVADCQTGDLYILGSHKNFSDGVDWLDVYWVQLRPDPPA